MKKVGQDIVENRRANPTDKKDVLNTMIYGKDPKTGEVMRDELIIAQMTTFLIAGKLGTTLWKERLLNIPRPRDHFWTPVIRSCTASEEPSYLSESAKGNRPSCGQQANRG
jgi:hypothetical protein